MWTSFRKVQIKDAMVFLNSQLESNKRGVGVSDLGIYVVNLAEMNDRTLKNAMNWVPENSVILFEDIDCMKTVTRRFEMHGGQVQQEGDIKTSVVAKTINQAGVSLSGLLNVLDGFSAPENVIYVMTTNDADAGLLAPDNMPTMILCVTRGL